MVRFDSVEGGSESYHEVARLFVPQSYVTSHHVKPQTHKPQMILHSLGETSFVLFPLSES